ncbi:protein SHI RELATED SEQUENCE 1-like isoform X2 [Chenopodium quinoa]|uniref:protein SHI RELATED SEQUENCE 1-like isoform X2 n=1 Tax=Chenopodium quinoa TaxID=63459 RepID=UPI000B7796C4|nr:protein SHI RELATED SEQUENCE 1-like isoform X2 [Chenopodium quinoa]
MAEFFSLGTGSSAGNNNNITYRNEQIHGYQQHETKVSSEELWQHLPYSQLRIAPTEEGGDETTRSGLMMMRMTSTSSGAGNISCQDCGNQAKKDCVYMRCRTCCKSRGFDCATHVKSTWVPATVRRERHQKLLQQHPQQQQEQQQQQQQQYLRGVNNPKRRRENCSTSLVCTQLPITTTNTNTASFSGMEVGNFPAEVSSSAVFRCVRVSSVDETDDEYAYQTAVNIGGHVFKGILYDHGVDHSHQVNTPSPNYGAGETSSGANLAASMAPPTSISAMPTSSSSLPVGYLDPSYYPLPLNTYLGPGTPFFPNPRP